jgi:DNA-directed RNA polymerase subunit M/transcription elongation factor TFIIS
MTQNLTSPQEFRRKIRVKLQEKLTQLGLLESIVQKLTLDECKVVDNMEKGVFNYTIQECNFRKLVKKWENPVFVQIYTDRLRTMFNNLGNPALMNGLKSGEILPQSVAFMTHQEFQPEKWNPLIEKKIKRDASKCDKKIGASTDMFTCSRCQSKKCTYYEMQTRSADEPATIFVTCLNCDKHWRM